MTTTRYILALMLIGLAGCGMVQSAQVQDQINSLGGMSKEQILMCMGPPQAKTGEGDVEVWTYSSLGSVQTSAFIQANQNSAFGSANTSQESCNINISMKNGVVVAANYRSLGKLLSPSLPCYPILSACANTPHSIIATTSTTQNVPHGTREKAKALAEKAAALINKDGNEKAFKQFQSKDGGFIDHDLYVFALDSSGVFLAHGAKPILVGKGSTNIKDADGYLFIQAFVNVKSADWVDYKWPDAENTAIIREKSAYIIRVGDNVVGVSYYK